MAQSLIDRREDPRVPIPARCVARATLRPGCLVSLVDLSASGVLIQGGRPLRPGARVHLQLVTPSRTFTLAAQVVRCMVWTLDASAGATYRGALRFEQRCEAVEESLRSG